MRHSLLFPAVILLLGAASVAAHAQEREIGGKLGASVATMGRDVTQSSDDPFRARTGITAGAYLFQPLADRLGVQFELLFTEKGGSVAFHDPSIVQGGRCPHATSSSTWTSPSSPVFAVLGSGAWTSMSSAARR
jgi:hypothetical protein